MPEKVLIVDDDEEFRQELKDALEDYEPIEASNGMEALKILRRANEIGAIILDVMMPGPSGIEILEEIRKTDPDLGIVILTGHSSKDVAVEALKGHANDYLEKPVDFHVLKDAIEKLLSKRRGEADAASLDLRGKIEKVKRFMERNRFKKTTLKEASQAVYLSPKYLSRLFKEYSKTGFNEYRLKIKIAEARKFLKKSGYNVNQISDKLGYENTESFIRQFKKFTGKTPTQYRNKTKKALKKKTGKRHLR
ncbi:MAG: response regulator [Candidatus Omnitrophica bacterium]|nr:response regulator [Candidatus Omnitrophota bacterium]